MKIAFLKWVDSVVGGLVAGILPAAGRGERVVPRRILLIRPGGIGDAVLLVPAILALKERFPESEITVLAERRNGQAFALCPALHRLLLYDSPADLWRAIRGDFDLVIDTEQWHRLSAVVARLTGAPFSIGFASNDRKRLFSHGVAYSHDDYEASSFFNLLAPMGMEPPACLQVPFLAIPPAAAARAETLIAPLEGERFVTIFPGASVPERRWGADRFKDVAQQLAQGGLPAVVVGGAADRADGEVIAGGSDSLNLAGRTSLAESAALIARSRLLISGDSGILHVAVGLGVPTVSLFGPGIEAKWGPKGEGDRIVNLKLPCSPCTRFGTTPPCPYNVRCLSEITAAQVVAAANELLFPPAKPDA